MPKIGMLLALVSIAGCAPSPVVDDHVGDPKKRTIEGFWQRTERRNFADGKWEPNSNTSYEIRKFGKTYEVVDLSSNDHWRIEMGTSRNDYVEFRDICFVEGCLNYTEYRCQLKEDTLGCLVRTFRYPERVTSPASVSGLIRNAVVTYRGENRHARRQHCDATGSGKPTRCH